MKCNKCGYENTNGASFCQECGNKLEVQISEPTPVTPVPEMPKVVNEVESSTMPTEPLNTEPVYKPEITQEETKKKKSKLPLVIILVVIVIALIGAAATFGKELLFKSDEDKLIEASVNTQLAKQKAIVGEVGFDEFMVDGVGVMEAAVIENLVKGLKVNYKVLSDAEAIKVEANLGVMMNGSDLIDITIHMNKEYVAVGIPALYRRVIYLNWEDIQEVLIKYELVSEEEMPDIDTETVIELIEAYAKALDYKSYEAYKDIDTAKYEDLTYGYLTGSMVDVSKGDLIIDAAGEELTYSGQIYTFDIEMDKYMEMSTNIMESIMEDENLMPMITEGISRVIDTMIEQEDIYGYNFVNQVVNYEDPADQWEASFADDLNDMKAEMILELEENYDEAMTELDGTFEDDEYIQMMDAMKDIYSEIDFESQLVVDNGYVMGTESFVSVDDSIVDAINDSPYLSEMMGYELASFNEMGIMFKVKTYQRTGIMQIDEAIEFEGLPESAQDFSELDEMELFEIYQEIMMNAEELSSGLMGGF